ncbi:MAG TPA: PQQ-dependent sugar dehydrogenase [Candidatus Nanoarchaeia archaeon]|nr:PQQ-dependent sugar dehydrogenase [Candidatus Nanoarchaeia archaeon]
MENERVFFISILIFVLVGALTFIVLLAAENSIDFPLFEASTEKIAEATVPEATEKISDATLFLERDESLQRNETAKEDGIIDAPVTRKLVVDCSGIPPPLSCKRRWITHTIVNCGHWIPGMNSPEELECENTTRDLEMVNLIVTFANHIRANITDEKFQTQMLADNPVWGGWELEFLGKDDFLITSINGKLYRYKEGMFRRTGGPKILRVENAGLLGMAIDPRFEDNGFIYLFYAYGYDIDAKENQTRRILSRVSRFTLGNRTLQSELVLLDQIPGDAQHVGGRIAIGPDEKLFIPIGDGSESMQSQNESSLLGKILRMNLDGTVPNDNPIPGSYVFSMGHRNPEGLAWDPESGQLFESEHGDTRKDEINFISKGGNYGRGVEECGEETLDEKYSDPLFCPRDWTLAPSGMAFVTDKDHPWYGSLFVASLQGRHLHRFIIEDGAIVGNEIFYYLDKTEEVESGGSASTVLERRIRDVEYHDGSLWVVFDQKGIVKLTPR